jgi:hypothetical protein
MRLAYTQATVNFPRTLNALPISNEVYRIFSTVSVELYLTGEVKERIEFNPLDDRAIGAMSSLVLRATQEIRSKEVPGNVTRGLPYEDARKITALVSGLDRQAAVDLIAFARTKGRTSQEIKDRRKEVLSTRLNNLANRFAKDCIRGARTYFLGEVQNAGPDAG